MMNDVDVEMDDVDVEMPQYRKPDEQEIARLCQNVTPKLRAFLRQNVWESWPEEWLRAAEGTEVGMVPFSENQWMELILERIPVEHVATVQ